MLRPPRGTRIRLNLDVTDATGAVVGVSQIDMTCDGIRTLEKMRRDVMALPSVKKMLGEKAAEIAQAAENNKSLA